MEQKSKTIQCLTAGVFLAFIFSLTITNIFAKKTDFSENENRSLATTPELSIQNIFSGNFDDEFESWFSDHFIHRDDWIELKAGTKRATGSIENNTVYFGKNAHLIQQFTSYDEKTLENNIQYINTFTKNNNIQANILLVPGASYGNRQFLPFGAYDLDEASLLNTIGNQFSTQNFMNITKDISDGDYYYKTDHHWNAKGAYIGYSAICKNVLHKQPNTFTYKKVADGFKGTMYSKSGAFWNTGDAIYKMCPENKKFSATVTYDNKTTSNSLFVEDNLDKKDKYTYYLDGNHAYLDIHTNVNNGKKAVVVKDSYSHILLPYLASEYSEIQVVDLRYYRQSVSSMLDASTDFYVIYSLESFLTDNNLAILW